MAVTWRELWRKTSGQIGDQLETRWLLEAASGLEPATLLRDLDEPAPGKAVDRLGELVSRRLSGEPLQHVLGTWSFRGLEVAVDRRALIPRPETELVVQLALLELDRIGTEGPGTELRAVDLGTGSGVVALSLVAEHESVRVIATDRDRAALELATANLSAVPAEAAARVQLVEGDWYGALSSGLRGRLDLIVSNPPYIAEHEWHGLEPTVRDFDPIGALVAGPTGLEAIAIIVGGAEPWLAPRGSVVVEIAPHQSGAVLELAGEAGFSRSRVEDDLAGRPRVVVASR